MTTPKIKPPKHPSAVATLQGTGPTPVTTAKLTQAQVCYEAYTRAVGSTAKWDALPVHMQRGWVAVADVKLGAG